MRTSGNDSSNAHQQHKQTTSYGKRNQNKVLSILGGSDQSQVLKKREENTWRLRPPGEHSLRSMVMTMMLINKASCHLVSTVKLQRN